MYVCMVWMMPLILLQYIYSQSAPFFGIFAAAGSEMLKLQILFFIHFFMVFVVVNKLISFEYQHICMNQGQTDPFVHIHYTCRQPFSINFQQDTVTLHSGDKGPSLDRLLFSFLCGYKCPDYLEMCSICQMKGKCMDYKVFMSNIQISEV